MSAIKLYKPCVYIQTFDETISLFDVPAEDVGKLAKMMDKAKFIPTGNGDFVAIHQIKKFGVQTFDEVDSFILSLTKDEQETMRREIIRRKKEGLVVNLMTTENFYNRAIKDRTT